MKNDEYVLDKLQQGKKMQDIYLYEDCDVLKNLLDIRDKNLLDDI